MSSGRAPAAAAGWGARSRASPVSAQLGSRGPPLGPGLGGERQQGGRQGGLVLPDESFGSCGFCRGRCGRPLPSPPLRPAPHACSWAHGTRRAPSSFHGGREEIPSTGAITRSLRLEKWPKAAERKASTSPAWVRRQVGSGKPAYGVTCLPAVLSGFPGFVLQRVKGLGTPSLSPRERIERRQSDAGGKPCLCR